MVISLRNVSFEYSRRPVFQDLNLQVGAFPTVVLGPNGAGKSTLLGLIVGQLQPTSGAVSVDDGERKGRQAIERLRKKTGWLPQDVKPLPGFNTRQQVAYAGWLKGMSHKNAWAAAADALRMVGLETFLERSASKLSGGQRRRLGMAQALVHRPRYLVLDEPYAGLDPEQRSLVRDTMKELSASTALVISTHQTEDLEDVYSHVVIIEDGYVVFSGSTSQFYEFAPREIPSTVRAEVAYRNILSKSRSEVHR